MTKTVARRSLALGLALCLTLATPSSARAQSPRVVVDQRIELVNLVFRLAGNPEQQFCGYPAYLEAQNRWFGAYLEHSAIRTAQAARSEHGIGYDAIDVLALGLDRAELARGRVRLASPDSQVRRRWGAADVDGFVRELDTFVRDSRFAAFWAEQSALGEVVRQRMSDFVERHVKVQWLVDFFGENPGQFTVVPGLCHGTRNTGPRVVGADGREEYFAILAIARPDSSGVPRFSTDDLPVIVHEFVHSFVNPHLDAQPSAATAAASAAFEATRSQLTAQAVQSELTMLNESLVRAAVVLYLAGNSGQSAADRELFAQQALGFVWLPELVQRLRLYSESRTSFPAFSRFVPEVLSLFSEVGPRVPELSRAFEARRPRFLGVEAVLVNSADSAGPGEIRLKFDRPMTRGIALGVGPAGMTAVPRLTSYAWDSSATELKVRAHLERGRDYQFVLLSAMTSAEGVPIAERVVDVRVGSSER